EPLTGSNTRRDDGCCCHDPLTPPTRGRSLRVNALVKGLGWRRCGCPMVGLAAVLPCCTRLTEVSDRGASCSYAVGPTAGQASTATTRGPCGRHGRPPTKSSLARTALAG